MSKKKDTIEHRMQNMKKAFIKTSELIDKLPEAIPNSTREMIKKAIVGDTELKEFIDGVDSNRPPRIFLIGRTGVGKSSLINALCGSYVAKVGDTRSCTDGVQSYSCMDGDRKLMEILDTRGIAESESLNEDISAEDMILNQVNEFSPDVAILMLNCAHRDDVNSDVVFLKKVSEAYEELNKTRLPVVAVVNKADEISPARHKVPSEYPQNKINNIEDVLRYYKGIIVKNGLKIDDIIAVSSLVDWQTEDGIEVTPEEIDSLPKKEVDNLQIAFDGRYNIEELFDMLIDAIQDCEARMGLRMAARLEEVINRFANHLSKVFSGISATVALTPIPVSDIYVLLILQAVLICIIAALSGRDISLDTAKEFIYSLVGIGGAGFLFKLVAQQASKLLNLVFPGAGSAVSASVAYAGTYAIGKAAIVYYIDGKDIEEAKQVFEKKEKQS